MSGPGSAAPLVVQFDQDAEEFFLAPIGIRRADGGVLFFPNKYLLNSRPLRAADAGRTLECPAPVLLTIPPGLPPNFYCYVSQTANGPVKFTPGTGVSLNGASAPVSHVAPPKSPDATQPGYVPQPFAVFTGLQGGSILVSATAQDVFAIQVYTVTVAGGGWINA